MTEHNLSPEDIYFLNHIRARIKAKGVSLSVISKEAGIRRATLSDLMQRPRLPDLQTLIKVTKFLGMRIRLVDDISMLQHHQTILADHSVQHHHATPPRTTPAAPAQKPIAAPAPAPALSPMKQLERSIAIEFGFDPDNLTYQQQQLIDHEIDYRKDD